MIKYLQILGLCLLANAILGQNFTVEPQHLYPFKGEYLNLKTLKIQDSESLLAKTFKTESKYVFRFKDLAIDQLAYKGNLFSTTPDNGLLMTNLETRAASPLPNNEKGKEVYGMNFLLEVEGGVVYVKHLKPEIGFMLYKYDEKGQEVFGIKLPHSQYIESGSLKYFSPYLRYFTHTASSIVFLSYSNRMAQTCIVSAEDGNVRTFDFTAHGIIRDEKGDMAIQGFVEIDAAQSSAKITYAEANFTIEQPSLKDCTDIETIVLGNKLIVAAWDRVKTGCTLFAVDLNSQKLLWEANVEQLNGKGEQYHNMVWLSSHEGKVILESFEKAGKYLQLFDAQTGKRLWSSMD